MNYIEEFKPSEGVAGKRKCCGYGSREWMARALAVSNGNLVKVNAPLEPGTYRVRYILGRGKKTVGQDRRRYQAIEPTGPCGNIRFF